MADTPHFDLPLRLSGSSFAEVEQDSYADIANSVEAIVRTFVGWRDYVPEFGIPEILFHNQPIGEELLTATIIAQDSRAEILVTEEPEMFNELVDNITFEVFPTGERS